MRSTSALLLGFLAAALTGSAWPDAGSRGAQVYVICGSCHGARAEGEPRLDAPSLAGLPEEYLLRQLRHFRDGIRGAGQDEQGRQMRQILLDAVPSEEDWIAVVAYIHSLPAAVPPVTLRGDRRRGAELYASCAGCHGPRAEGNDAVKAPPLRWLPDWYIARQVNKFGTGQRGSAPEDVPGTQMRAAAATLHSDSDAPAVAAFIVTSLSR